MFYLKAAIELQLNEVYETCNEYLKIIYSYLKNNGTTQFNILSQLISGGKVDNEENLFLSVILSKHYHEKLLKSINILF